MPRTEEANQRVRDAQRAKILDSARKVFALKGIAATMADIASAAEVSQGLAYRYFASKDAIYAEIVQQTAQFGVASLKQVLDMPGTPGERLEYLISTIFANSPERLEYYQFLIQAFNDEATPQYLREMLLGQIQTFQSVLRQLITEGQRTGEVAQDAPEQLVIAVIAYFNGLSALAMRGDLKGNFPDPRIILRILKP